MLGLSLNKSSADLVKEYFHAQGLKTQDLPKYISFKDYFSVEINEQKYVVEVNNWKNKTVNLPSIENFYHFLSSPKAKEFAGGLFITHKGYSETVKFFLKANPDKEIVLGLLENNISNPKKTKININWLYPLDYSIKNKQKNNSIQAGVFACKGGVGKTTVTAHLGLLLSELNYSVLLVDEDPERHLKRILDSVIKTEKKSLNLKCINSEELEEEADENYDFILYDYPPSLNGSSIYSVSNLNYCLVPINLSPLALGLEAEIIHKTFNYINQLNSSIKILALINNEIDSNHPTSKALKQEFKKALKQYPNAHLLPFSIRHSSHLYYWGKSNILSGMGRQSNAYQDFLALADYLIKLLNFNEDKK